MIGASAGGVAALRSLVARLPRDLASALFVVLHTGRASVLPDILRRSGPLPAAHAEDEEPIAPGRIYVAPPERHLLVRPGAVRLVDGPRENNHRPAIDPLFRSAARSYRERVLGIVLTGEGACGALGLAAIKRAGGVAAVQDPAEAGAPSMPREALAEARPIDYCLTLDGLAALIARLAPAAAITAAPPPVDHGKAKAAPSLYGCPDCGGVLSIIDEGDSGRFRCRVGHRHTWDSLADRQDEQIEQALWAALRALEENASVADRLATRSRARGLERSAASFEDRAALARRRARLLREAIEREGRGR